MKCFKIEALICSGIVSRFLEEKKGRRLLWLGLQGRDEGRMKRKCIFCVIPCEEMNYTSTKVFEEKGLGSQNVNEISCFLKLVFLFSFFFGYFESRSGYKDQPMGRFSPSPSVVWRSVLWQGDWRILLLWIYIPAPFTESFDRLGRRMIFKVAGAGIELEPYSSSWPFSERLIH